MMNERIKVYLCHDHFERLCKDSVCETCPSRVEHKEAVMSWAEVQGAGEEKVMQSILTEIKSLRRTHQVLHEDLVNLKKSVLGDGNGERGLRARVMLIEHDMVRSQTSYASWLAIAAVLVSAATALIMIIQG